MNDDGAALISATLIRKIQKRGVMFYEYLVTVFIITEDDPIMCWVGLVTMEGDNG